MGTKSGFTIIEILVVLIILLVVSAVIIPYFTSSIWQSKVQYVENNLRAIGAAEQKYNEDHSVNNIPNYCNTATIPVACDNLPDICSVLRLSLSDMNTGFTYSLTIQGSVRG